MITRVVVALLCALTLTACRVDVGVIVDMTENGSGVLTVTITVDDQVMAAAPEIAADVRLDDLQAAGWTTEAVTTVDGGARLVLQRPFDTPEQATTLLAGLNGPNGPFQAVALQRDASRSAVEHRLTGRLQVDRGLEAFADPALLSAVGADPWAAEIAAGSDLEQALGITFEAIMPGQVVSSTSTVQQPVDRGDAATRLAWQVPFSGPRVEVTTTSVISLEQGGPWSTLSVVARASLALWLAASAILATLVVRAGRRKRRAARNAAWP